MAAIFFNRDRYESLYNCSLVEIDKIPLEKRIFIPESIINMTLAAFYYLLYFPCMYSLARRLNEGSCQKLIFLIGIADLGILWVLGFWVGFMSLTGAVYCSYPTIGYLIGILVNAGWFCETMAAMTLAINRCLDILAPHLADFLFAGKRTLIWIFACVAYFSFWAITQKPVLYSSIFFGGWFYTPYAGYVDMKENPYISPYYVIHNNVNGFGLPTIYLCFCLGLFIKYKGIGSMRANSGVTKAQIMSFLQVFGISALNTLASLLYIYCQNVTNVTQTLITISQISWLHIHGFPPVLYLLLNKSIRKDTINLFHKIFHANKVYHIHGVTAVARSGITDLVTQHPAALSVQT